MNAYKIGPDIGDAIAALAVCRVLGRGHVRLFETPGTKGWSDDRYNYIRPLIAMQPYAKSVQRWSEDEAMKFTHDFTCFRDHWEEPGTLAHKQAIAVGLKAHDVDVRIPWLTIPDYARHGKIVIACSSRYQGALHYFRIVRAKALDCLFIGLPDEYEQFCWNQGAPNQRNKVGVRYQPVRDAVEAARVIMGARLYVGNPTSSTWIAIGCGHPNMLLDCSQRDTDIDRAGVRNVRSVGDNPKLHEWAGL